MQTRVYKFGLRPPTQSDELVADQIQLAHRYFNKLVELERARRMKVRSILGAHGDVEPIAKEVAELLTALETARESIAKTRQASRTRSEDPAVRQTTRDLVAKLREARGRLKIAKAALKTDVDIQAKILAANQEAQDAVKQARASCDVYWGTYLLQEQAMDAARKAIIDPHFRRWDGSGSIAVQLQGALSWEAACAGEDTRLRIKLAGQPRSPDTTRSIGLSTLDELAVLSEEAGGYRELDRLDVAMDDKPAERPGSPDITPSIDPYKPKRTRGELHIRVGSDGRNPIWAIFPLIQHRAVPDGAEIMWAKVVRERLGGKDRWSLHLTLRLPDEWRAGRCGEGAVAVDLGWRQREGTLRVAYIRGTTPAERLGGSDEPRTSTTPAERPHSSDKGQVSDIREILLQPEILAGIRKVDDLRSIRDQRLDAFRPWFLLWLTENTAKLPDWMKPLIEHVALWKSPARFARLAIEWRERRFEDDTEGFQRLETWRQKDKHLWLWEANLRDKVLRRRTEQYRVLGAELARTYRVLVLERFDLRKVQEHVKPESEKREIQPARSQQRLAAPSELRQCLIGAFQSRGGVVEEENAVDSTRACHVCGLVEAWDAVMYLSHVCTGCGTTWDQDDNACQNLLIRYFERVGTGAGTKAARVNDSEEVTGKRESKWGKLGRHKSSRSKEGTKPPVITE